MLRFKSVKANLPGRLYAALVLLIILIGAFVRISHYPHIPPGLNVDEAGSMYEAYSLAQTGRDMWGNFLPPYFPYWGSGQNVLLAYLSIPVVRLFGLSVFSARLVPLVLGILTLPLLVFGLRPLGRFPAALAALMVAILPWHFMLSRWALESNLAPFFMLLGCVMLSRALITGKRRWIWPCLMPFALALYAYGTTVIVLPTMALLVVCRYWRLIRMNALSWMASLLGFSMLAFPFAVFFLENNVLGRNLSWTDKLPFATPLLPASRLEQINTGNWPTMFRANMQFFGSGFNDGTVYNVLPGFLPLLRIILPLTICGIFIALFSFVRGRKKETAPAEIVVNIFLFWALASLPMAALFMLNVNRFNHFFLPAIVLAAWAGHWLITHFNTSKVRMLLSAVLVTALLAEGGLSLYNYFGLYEDGPIRERFNAGLGEAFEAAQRLPVRQVKVTGKIFPAYVFTLFFAKYPPREFQAEAQRRLANGIYSIGRVGKYVFSNDSLEERQPYGYLEHRGEFDNARAVPQVVFQNEGWEVGIAEWK